MVDEFIVGIDYSLTCPCVCISPAGDIALEKSKIHFLTKEQKYVGQFGKNIFGTLQKEWSCYTERYLNISNWVLSLVPEKSHIFLEDYALHGKGRVFEIAENTQMLKYFLYQKGIMPKLVPPTVLKKYWTDKGNAKKDLMYEFWLEKTEVDLRKLLNYTRAKLESPISDIVDSVALALFGIDQISNIL